MENLGPQKKIVNTVIVANIVGIQRLGKICARQFRIVLYISIKTKSIVLEMLSDLFDTFKLNYSMNKLSYNLTELMKELQAVEVLFSKGKNRGGEAHFSVNMASISRTKKFSPAS